MTMYDKSNVKVYTVNGAASNSSSSLPDWLTRKRNAKKGKRAIKELYEGTIELIQEFEFPEASNIVKTTRDGHHAIATGVYKPQMRVYDLDHLTLKFERHFDADNIDFTILSDDWTKVLLLQADRSVELHTQGGFYFRTRIPHFGRAINYHYPSCDVLVGAQGHEVYRLNLDQGRFLNPFVLEGEGGEDVVGVNAVDINPAHQLFAFGVDGGPGTVEFWDPRSRTRAGVLRLPRNQLLSIASALLPSLPGVDDEGQNAAFSVTAISSRIDGLSYAIGTSTGHTLLYDIRSPRHLAIKDLGYGLPVKCVSWIEGGSRMAGDGMVLSADKKVIKIWDRNNPSGNFVSVTPTYDINHVHHIPGSGLIMTANEGIQMTNYYIPQLGPASKWCSFLDNITEEMETTRNVYEDYKFVERGELAKLGLDHLVGSPALKPYMHGFLLSLELYDTARAIANPFAYEEHRARQVQEKLDKLSETRIRTRKATRIPKVNKALAERIRREEEREQRREEKKFKKMPAEGDREGEGAIAEKPMDTGEGKQQQDEQREKKKKPSKANLLNDPRFSALFENPEFEVDEDSREFSLVNPSFTAQRLQKGGRTAAEKEEEESDQQSSSFDENPDNDSDDSDEDSSDAGNLDLDRTNALHSQKASRVNPGPSTGSMSFPTPRRPQKQLRMVAAAPQAVGKGNRKPDAALGKDATFGQRRQVIAKASSEPKCTAGGGDEEEAEIGATEFTWIPSATADSQGGRGDRGSKQGQGQTNKLRAETFGVGLERGGVVAEMQQRELSESERHGRTRRRTNVRSGSKNAFRGL